MRPGSEARVRLDSNERRIDMRRALLFFALALVLYAPGIVWGLPHASAPGRIFAWGSDEIAPLGPFAQTYATVLGGDVRFDPRYPLVGYLIQLAFMLPYLAWLRLTGDAGAMTAAYPYGFEDPVTALAGLTLFARASNLLMVSAVPMIAYWTARHLWSRTAAIATATLVLLLYQLFFYARTSNVDGTALFFLGLSLLVFARCLREGITMRRAAGLGLWAALAIAAKDQSYALLVPVAIVLAGRTLFGQGTAAQGLWDRLKPLALGLVVSVAAYAVTSGLLFDPALFSRHVEYVLEGSGLRANFSAPPTLLGYASATGSFVRHLSDAMGAPILVASVLGLVVAARSDRVSLLWALPALGLLVGVILPTRFVLFRFVMPAAYVLTFFAGFLAAQLLGRAVKTPVSHHRMRAWRAAVLGGFALAAGWSLLRGADLTYQMLADSRYGLATWLRSHVRPGERVGYYASPVKLPPVEGSVLLVQAPHAEGDTTVVADWPEFLLLIPQQPHELVHEQQLTPEQYEELRTGQWPYELVYAAQTRRLFDRRPVTWVNPPVRVYMRTDVARRLPAGARRLDLEAGTPSTAP